MAFKLSAKQISRCRQVVKSDGEGRLWIIGYERKTGKEFYKLKRAQRVKWHLNRYIGLTDEEIKQEDEKIKQRRIRNDDSSNGRFAK